MIKFLKSLFGFGSSKPVATPAPLANTVPYKVPEPAATTPIPFVVTNSNPADNVPVAVTEVAEVTKPVSKAKAAAIKAPAKTKAAPKAKATAPKVKDASAKPKGPATKKPKISIAK